MRKTNIGGQAVIEGVMMKNVDCIAIAVRKPDNEIEIKKEKLTSISNRYKFLKLPIFRGIAAFVEAMILGVKSLTYSAELYGEDTEENKPGKFEEFLSKVTGRSVDDIVIFLSVVIAIGLAVLLFIVMPTFIVNFLRARIESRVLLSLLEGVLRITIFISYIVIVSRLKDIQRVFQYHGAEHKVIHCYESEQEINIDNARKFTTLHPRCGTSFLLFVMVISVFVFTLLGWQNQTVISRIFTRILLLPVIAGLSYEVIRWAGKSDSIIVKIISYPGLMLQKLTTREPDDSQLEVAIKAFEGVMPVEKDGDIAV